MTTTTIRTVGRSTGPFAPGVAEDGTPAPGVSCGRTPFYVDGGRELVSFIVVVHRSVKGGDCDWAELAPRGQSGGNCREVGVRQRSEVGHALPR